MDQPRCCDGKRFCLSIGSDQHGQTTWYCFNDPDVALTAWDVLERTACPEVTATLEDADTSRLAVLHHHTLWWLRPDPPPVRLRATVTRPDQPALPSNDPSPTTGAGPHGQPTRGRTRP